MVNNTYAVIMAGGSGTRFWPVSRIKYPKQFLDILGNGRTLIQATFDRFVELIPAERIFVVTSDQYTGLVSEQLPDIPKKNILSEPERKNTAPCVAYISFVLNRIDPSARMIVAPADHLIADSEGFNRTCLEGLRFVERHAALVTIGVRPSYPNTGYGYIKYDRNNPSGGVHKAVTFTEKPSVEVAEKFLESGDYLWNAGIFIWRIEDILNAFCQYSPELFRLFDDDAKNLNGSSDSHDDALRKIYSVCENVSIDHAIMEKAENVHVIPSSFGWSDLGTWNSAYENLSKDGNANAVPGANAMLFETNNCLFNIPDHKLIIAQGLDDYIVVDTADVILICKKQKEQEIKQYVLQVREQKGEKFI